MRIERTGIQPQLEDALQRHHVPGASIALLHKNELTTAAAGVANVSTQMPLTTDTLMHIGSITKVMNATLVMQLVDEGTVSLDDRVQRYLPDLKLLEGAALQDMTVRMLLNHTSGIDGDMVPDQGHDEETIDKAIGRFAKLGQVHCPGAEYSYCNAGSVIAGYLVQKLRGESWYRVLRERLLDPAGMTHSAVLPEEALLQRASVGHYLNAATKKLSRTSVAFLPMSFAPAGTTMMASASDLLTFARAHMDNGVAPNGVRLLSAASVQEMQQMTVDNRGRAYTYGDGMGLGWTIFENGMLHHVGGGPGIISALYVLPKEGFAAAILTNAEHGLVLINEFMEPWLGAVSDIKPLGVATSLPRLQVSSDASGDLEGYVGTYEDVFKRFSVARDERGLLLSQRLKLPVYESISLDPTAPVRLLPLGDHRFLLGAEIYENGHLWDIFRTFTFKNPDVRGRMGHLGFGFHVYPRRQ